MVPLLAALVPILLAFTLIALAHDDELRPRRMAQVLGGAIIGGPVAMTLLGFGGWLLMVALSVAALTAYAARRHEAAFRLTARE
jgi:hypothetical protein